MLMAGWLLLLIVVRMTLMIHSSVEFVAVTWNHIGVSCRVDWAIQNRSFSGNCVPSPLTLGGCTANAAVWLLLIISTDEASH